MTPSSEGLWEYVLQGGNAVRTCAVKIIKGVLSVWTGGYDGGWKDVTKVKRKWRSKK